MTYKRALVIVAVFVTSLYNIKSYSWARRDIYKPFFGLGYAYSGPSSHYLDFRFSMMKSMAGCVGSNYCIVNTIFSRFEFNGQLDFTKSINLNVFYVQKIFEKGIGNKGCAIRTEIKVGAGTHILKSTESIQSKFQILANLNARFEILNSRITPAIFYQPCYRYKNESFYHQIGMSLYLDLSGRYNT